MATAHETQAEYRRLLRLFLNDTPELNRLIRKEEASDAKLDLAIRMTIDDWNITPPLLDVATIQTFPSLILLIYGAAIQVLRSSGLLHSRNELSYSSGGVSVRVFDKTAHYQSWIAQFQQEYEMKKMGYKKAVNMDTSMAVGVDSEYASIAGFW